MGGMGGMGGMGMDGGMGNFGDSDDAPPHDEEVCPGLIAGASPACLLRKASADARPLAHGRRPHPAFCRTQEDDEGDLGDLGPSALPPLEDDGPPPLESSGNGDDGPPALEPDISQMKEVD